MPTRMARILGGMAELWLALLFLSAGFRILADCSSYGLPFADLGSETTFCAAIAEAYYSGLTNGTSATTYSPSDDVTREQTAAWATRTLDAALVRGSRRAALDQWWTSTPHYDQGGLALTTVGNSPELLESDGTDIWVPNNGGTVSRVRASDGKLLDTWTGATLATGVLIAMGRIFVTGAGSPGSLYSIDPTAAAGPVTTLSSALGANPTGIAFDGNRIWIANNGTGEGDGSISIVTPGTWSVTLVTTGFVEPAGILYDGSNIWVTDFGAGTLLRLDDSGNIVHTVPVGNPLYPAFDGHNIWVPSFNDNSLAVVRASDGTVLKTFSAGNRNRNGLNQPTQAAFDGQRILVTDRTGGVSLFRATDLSIIGNPATPGITSTFGVCSDGVNFWVGLNPTFLGPGAIGRF